MARRSRRGGPKPNVVGDSLAFGTAPHLKGRKAVKGGMTSEWAVDQLKRIDDGKGPIVFDAGTNDLDASVLKRSLERLKKIAKGRPVFVLEIQDRRSAGHAKAKNKVLRQSGFNFIRTGVAGVASDGVHAKDYKKRAALIKRALRQDAGSARATATPARAREGSTPDSVAQAPGGGLDPNMILSLDKARLDDMSVDEIFSALEGGGHSLEEAHDIYDAYSKTPLGDGRPRGEVELATYEPPDWKGAS